MSCQSKGIGKRAILHASVGIVEPAEFLLFFGKNTANHGFQKIKPRSDKKVPHNFGKKIKKGATPINRPKYRLKRPFNSAFNTV